MPLDRKSDSALPRHIAIVMDGNGRWAQKRGLPRIAGHKAGAESVKRVIKACKEKGIGALTLWAFSTENWGRPSDEVQYLMSLFRSTIEKAKNDVHKNNIRFRVIGGRKELDSTLQNVIEEAEKLTENNTGLNVTIALNYSGRWDLTQAMQKIASHIEKREMSSADINPELIRSYLSLADLPEPDLFIRTSGEIRISNYFLWQLAYTELYFTPVFWPAFTEAELDKALEEYVTRQRRFGLTAEQIEAKQK
ncbi:MAG: isoprenyl transferase [Gammaproteobacteria bacterium]